jgi:outer membrane protein
LIYIKSSLCHHFENRFIKLITEKGYIMRNKTLVAALAVMTSLAPIVAQAQSSSENPWMVRVRAVDLLWANGQSGSIV